MLQLDALLRCSSTPAVLAFPFDRRHGYYPETATAKNEYGAETVLNQWFPDSGFKNKARGALQLRNKFGLRGFREFGNRGLDRFGVGGFLNGSEAFAKWVGAS